MLCSCEHSAIINTFTLASIKLTHIGLAFALRSQCENIIPAPHTSGLRILLEAQTSTRAELAAVFGHPGTSRLGFMRCDLTAGQYMRRHIARYVADTEECLSVLVSFCKCMRGCMCLEE